MKHLASSFQALEEIRDRGGFGRRLEHMGHSGGALEKSIAGFTHAASRSSG
jgi:hypothetical protein